MRNTAHRQQEKPQLSQDDKSQPSEDSVTAPVACESDVLVLLEPQIREIDQYASYAPVYF